jgi:hypothetical protein
MEKEPGDCIRQNRIHKRHLTMQCIRITSLFYILIISMLFVELTKLKQHTV